MRSLIIVLCALLPPVAGLASDYTDGLSGYDRILLPLSPPPRPIAGERGSLWDVKVLARNNAGEPLYVTWNPPVPGFLCAQCPSPVQPGASLNPAASLGNVAVGEFVYVTLGRQDDVAMTLRVQDLSRQAQTWGTAIPVVRQRDVFTRRITLLDVPSAPEFRTALRIYDYDFFSGRQVTIRVFDAASDVVLAETTVGLVLPSPTLEGAVPATFTTGNLAASFPQVASASRLRIEIEPATPGLRFWAFASITNNETQHVTLALPQ